MRARVPVHTLGRVVVAACLLVSCGDDFVEAATGTASVPGSTGSAPGDDSGSSGTSDVDGPICGDGVVQEGEECDGEDLGEVSCETYGFDSGIVTCSPNCRAITNACWTCGDGVLHPAKTCDGELLRGETCESQGFAGGELACAEDCRDVDTSSCEAFETCGDGTLDPGEQCDGDQLSGHSCQSFGFDTGTLTCSAECVFDTSGCGYHPLDCTTQGKFCYSDSQCCAAGQGGNHLGKCYGFCT